MSRPMSKEEMREARSRYSGPRKSREGCLKSIFGATIVLILGGLLCLGTLGK